MIEDVFDLTTDSSVIMAIAFSFFVVSLVYDVTYDKECKMKVLVSSFYEYSQHDTLQLAVSLK